MSGAVSVDVVRFVDDPADLIDFLILLEELDGLRDVLADNLDHIQRGDINLLRIVFQEKFEFTVTAEVQLLGGTQDGGCRNIAFSGQVSDTDCCAQLQIGLHKMENMQVDVVQF